VIWLQFKSDNDDSMHQRSLFVKGSVAASAQKLALSGIFLLREQISTPSAPSELPFPQRFAHCVHHSKKMLYDNSQLVRVYLHGWQVTGNQFFRTITEEIVDYVVREMLGESGGSCSTRDADSEGEEGKFFVWTGGEIRREHHPTEAGQFYQ